ncbi:hypothetical protein DFS34DRAFT_639845 [Phlyctochytrium arcticum]|nr:hypothetical protein DFS34DRAFT_639845 [Phlyctochytrium arcticum]
MMAGSKLPTEVLEKIAGKIEYYETLLALSSVSHTWHQIVHSRLYTSIAFWSNRRTPGRLQLLLKTLAENPQLGSSVRHLELCWTFQSSNEICTAFYAQIISLTSFCPNLTSLDYTSLLITDEALLGTLENCRSLKGLRIAECCRITSKGILKMLPLLVNLRNLHVPNVLNFDDDCLSGVAKMCPLLEDLDLQCTPVTRTGLSSLMELATNLKSLNLSECYGRLNSKLRAIMEEKLSRLTFSVCRHGL